MVVAAGIDDHPQAALLKALQPGDLIFYRPAQAETFADLDPDDFDKFPVVAAFVQALPYMMLLSGKLWSSDPVDFKPWHHVSVCVQGHEDGGLREVGFVPETYDDISGEEDADAADANGPLVNRPFVPSTEFRFDVLRLPPIGANQIADAIAGAAKDQVDDGVVYSTNGLLSFAFAMKARLLPVSSARTKAGNLAYGTHVQARKKEASGDGPPEESCVTAVGKAVAEATGLKLGFVEPDPPGPLAALLAYQFSFSPVAQAIQAILARIENAGKAVMLAELLDKAHTVEDLRTALPSAKPSLGLLPPDVDFFRGEELDHLGRGEPAARLDAVFELREAETRAALRDAPGVGHYLQPPPWLDGLDILDPPVPEPIPVPPAPDPNSPGPDVTTSGYLATLELFAEHFTDVQGASLEELGIIEQAKSGVPNEDHLVVSPAMLWDGLLARGFTRVAAP